MSPMLLLAGLMSLQVGLFSKLSLWSLRVIKACCFAIMSILSPMFKSFAMVLSSPFICFLVGFPDIFSQKLLVEEKEEKYYLV